jgi:uncharacterized repeat protein (TIGR03806 family)
MRRIQQFFILAIVTSLFNACGGGADNLIQPPSSMPQLNIADISVSEGDTGTTAVEIEVSLTQSANQLVSFAYATADISALNGLDYTARSGTASIASGLTSTTLSIPVLGDQLVELDESFSMILSTATNATINTGSAIISIVDNDETTIPALVSRPLNPNCQIPTAPISDIQLTQMFNISFDAPILMLQAPGNNNRWYVVEQDGLIKTFMTNGSSATIFADLTDRAIYNGGQDERGLLGMAFHPDFQSNNQIFLYYISIINGQQTIVSRYTSPDNGVTLTVPAFAAEDKILELAQPESNHNGGHIAFDPNGYLFIGLGDGGGSNDAFLNGLNTQTLLGSMLRIDVDSIPAAGKNYAIPNDNPFVSNSQVLDEIYAYGLRNPWRWSFDRLTGDLYLGDVGQGAREEIDIIAGRQHYGWGCFEGSQANSSYAGNCSGISNNLPIHEYPRSEGKAVVGGYVYRGSNPNLANFVGTYFFADFGFGTIWGLDPAAADPSSSNRILLNTGRQISSFAEDNSAELYALSWSDGLIFRIDHVTTANSFPTLLSQTGCVDPANPQAIDSGLIPYTINAPFWSDGAEKDRWFALRDGSNITIEADGDWTFPIGSILMKNFNLNNQLVETRLLVHHDDDSWGGYSYEWNDTLTDASLVLNVKTKVINGQSYQYPSSGQCAACHTDAAGDTLGLETAQMNRKQIYSANNNSIGNQITALDNIGLFTTSPGNASTLKKMTNPHNTLIDDGVRVRAYLHTNCAQCHRPDNAISNIDIDFRDTSNWSDLNICNVAPTAGDLGVQGAQRLVPGNPDSSIIYLRLSRRDSDGMPPISSSLVDYKESDLVRRWITDLQQCP